MLSFLPQDPFSDVTAATVVCLQSLFSLSEMQALLLRTCLGMLDLATELLVSHNV